MPNFFTHLAAAKRYAEKHSLNADDAREFYRGNVYPDLFILHNGASKTETHCRRPVNSASPNTPIEKFCRGRVDFDRFFANHRIETPFEKGVLMHLIVDNECYPSVLDIPRFYSLVQNGVRTQWVVNSSFDSQNDYLRNKYGLDFEMTGVANAINKCIAIWAEEDGETPQYSLLDSPAAVKKLDDFIEKISDIDLDKFAKKFRH